jgi:hypothetical protein
VYKLDIAYSAEQMDDLVDENGHYSNEKGKYDEV